MNTRIDINVLYGVIYFDHREYGSIGGMVLHSVHLTKTDATHEKRIVKHEHKAGGLSKYCCWGHRVVAFKKEGA